MNLPKLGMALLNFKKLNSTLSRYENSAIVDHLQKFKQLPKYIKLNFKDSGS
jgi:hypothetical protein